jgi:F0F1-type ATP synthase beta subunit
MPEQAFYMVGTLDEAFQKAKIKIGWFFYESRQ